MNKIGSLGGVEIARNPDGLTFAFTNGKIVFADEEGNFIRRKPLESGNSPYFYDITDDRIATAKRVFSRIVPRSRAQKEYFEILADAFYSINYSYRAMILDPCFKNDTMQLKVGEAPACGTYTLDDWRVFEKQGEEYKLGVGTLYELALFYAVYYVDGVKYADIAKKDERIFLDDICKEAPSYASKFEAETQYIGWEHKPAKRYDFANTCKIVRLGDGFAVCGGPNEGLMSCVSFDKDLAIASAKAPHAVGFIVRRR